jgi:hypothetical protein
MWPGVRASRFPLTVAMLSGAGCMTVEPAPLVSNDFYRFGVASRVFHRDISEVAKAARKAMHDLSFEGIRELDEVGKTRIEALAGDNRRVQVDLEWNRGTPEGTPLPLVGIITGARVRVGDSGARELSKTLLDRIAFHLKSSPTSTATSK